jgi:hypothetical protein
VLRRVAPASARTAGASGKVPRAVVAAGAFVVGLLANRVKREGLAFLGVVGVAGDVFEAGLEGFGSDFLLLALAFDDFGQQPVLAALFLAGFVELLLDAGEFGLQGGDGIALGGEIAGDEQGGGDEVGLEAALALFEVMRLRPNKLGTGWMSMML